MDIRPALSEVAARSGGWDSSRFEGWWNAFTARFNGYEADWEPGDEAWLAC